MGLAGALAGCLGACGNLLSTGEYDVSRSVVGGDAAAPSAEGGSPSGESAARAACDACVREQCPSASSACTADEACSSIVSCRDACTDPVCMWPCAALGYSAEYATLNQCKVTSCVDECRIGRHFECTGLYAPPAEYGNQDLRLSLAVSLFPENPLAGAVVRACRRGSIECESVASEITADLPATVELTAPAESTGFRGHFLITHPDILPTLFLRTLPFVPGAAWNFGIATRATISGYLELARESLDPARSYYSLFPTDCFGQFARGVRLEIDSADAETTLYYWKGGTPVAGLSESVGEGASLNHVPSGTAGQVQVIEVETGRVVSRLQVKNLPGHYAQVNLSPLTKSDIDGQ